jgi:hypothetical protein
MVWDRRGCTHEDTLGDRDYKPCSIPEDRDAMMPQYRLKVPMQAAILKRTGGVRASITLPAGAILRESTQRSTTLPGMVGVYWEDRHYSVFLWDLLEKAEIVSTA